MARRKDKGARRQRRGAEVPSPPERDEATTDGPAAGVAGGPRGDESGGGPAAPAGAGARERGRPHGGAEEPPIRIPGAATRIGLALFLLLQILLPLRYYTILENPYDERFAWRMFSPIRMLSCDPQFRIDGAPLQLETEFHTAWITLLKRGRPAVVEEAGRHLCARHPESEITFYYRCRELDGEIQVLNDGSESLCGGQP